MARTEPPNPFELENLEPRILLSADPLLGGAIQPVVPDTFNPFDTGLEIPVLEENLSPSDDTYQSISEQESSQYDPSLKLSGIFSGLAEEDPSTDETSDASMDSLSPIGQSDHEITEAENNALIEGMDGLKNLGSQLEEFDAFGTTLPLTKSATMGKLLGPYEVLDSRLSTPVYDYFADTTDPPVTDGLLTDIQAISKDPAINRDTLSGGYNASSGEIRFSLNYKATRKGQVRPIVRKDNEQLSSVLDKDVKVPTPVDPYTTPHQAYGLNDFNPTSKQNFQHIDNDDNLAVSSPTEIVVIDPRVPDYQNLITMFQDSLASDESGERNFEIVILNAEQEGLDQIGDILAGRENISAVHILIPWPGRCVAIGCQRDRSSNPCR